MPILVLNIYLRKFDSSYYINYQGGANVQHNYACIWLTHSSNIRLWTPIDSVIIEIFHMHGFLLFKNYMYWKQIFGHI